MVMKVVETFGLRIGVQNDDGQLIAIGFSSEQGAQDWIAMYHNPDRAEVILARKLAAAEKEITPDA
jgi:hypothetical protein